MWNKNFCVSIAAAATEKPVPTKHINDCINNNVLDSGFSSLYSEDKSMRGCCCKSVKKAEIEFSRSLLRSFKSKYSNVNKLIESRKQERNGASNAKRRNQSKTLEPYELYFRQDNDGDTQLHISAAMKHLEASFHFIDSAPHPCLLDILNNDFQTALHLAVLNCEPRIVRRLVLAGANPKVRTIAGNTALHLACRLGDLACAKALTESLTHEESQWVERKGGRSAVLLMSQHLELKNYVGQTSLHIAVTKGYIDLANYLLHLGARADTQEDLAGKTSLHLAVENNHCKLVNILAKMHRSCIDMKTYAGVTAYQLALEVDKNLAKDLLHLGASRNRRTDKNVDTDGNSDGEAAVNVLVPKVVPCSRINLGCNAAAIVA